MSALHARLISEVLRDSKSLQYSLFLFLALLCIQRVLRAGRAKIHGCGMVIDYLSIKYPANSGNRDGKVL